MFEPNFSSVSASREELRILTTQAKPPQGPASHSAIAELDRIANLSRDLGEQDAWVAYCRLAEACVDRGDLVTALLRLTRAIAMSERVSNDPRPRLTVQVHLAKVQLARGALLEAEAAGRRALKGAEGGGWMALVATSALMLGSARHVAGALDEADALYRRAASSAREAGDGSCEASARTLLGLLLLERGSFADAASELDVAQPMFDSASDAIRMTLASGLAAVARARRDGMPLRPLPLPHDVDAMGLSDVLAMVHTAFLDGTHGTHVVGREGPRPAAFERAVVRAAFERAIASRAGAGPAEAPSSANDTACLVVHRNGDWFRAPMGTRVRCQARPILKRLLIGLAQKRCEAPNVGVSLLELQAIIWPDQQMSLDDARNRIKQGIAVLRRLGLGNAVVRQQGGGGYLLDASVPLRFAE
jgi:predicted negative regulator of RcsB-dependent stress response